MRLPDFIIIGAAKCGTTTLARLLSQHPGLHMSLRKEPAFFAREGIYGKGADYYASLFSDADEHQLCYEASTIYTRYPVFSDVPQRMSKLLPQAKLIFVMREPVQRTYSDYAQLMRSWRRATQISFNDLSFEDALAIRERSVSDMESDSKHMFQIEMSSIVPTSKYMLQIDQYLQYYDRQQMLFLFFEDFVKSPEKVCNKITEFLGIPPLPKSSFEEETKANTRQAAEASTRRYAVVQTLRRFVPEKMKYLLPKGMRYRIYDKLGASIVGKALAESEIPRPMLPATREALGSEFSEENNRLASFLNMQLPPQW